MTDEELRRCLRAAERDYNRPPPTPRAEIWAAITAARGGEVEPTATLPLPWRWQAGWLRRAASLAAMLMIGIGLGQWSTRGSAGGVGRNPGAGEVVAHSPALPTSPAGHPQSAAAPETVWVSAPARPETVLVVRNASAPALAAATPFSVGAYEPAVAELVTRARGILAAFREEAAAERVDPSTIRSAGRLLGDVRLLLDSPAAEEPRGRTLMEELELVLAQVGQLPAEPQPSELRLIVDAMDESELLARLRARSGPALLSADN